MYSSLLPSGNQAGLEISASPHQATGVTSPVSAFTKNRPCWIFRSLPETRIDCPSGDHLRGPHMIGSLAETSRSRSWPVLSERMEMSPARGAASQCWLCEIYARYKPSGDQAGEEFEPTNRCVASCGCASTFPVTASKSAV